MTRPPFSPVLRGAIIDALHGTGARSAVIDAAMAKWEAGEQPSPCIEETKGKPYATESSGTFPCQCIGCIERKCFFMFRQVRRRFTGA